MLSALADHLWQSLLFCALAAALALLARGAPARVRLWTWRACAIKFLVPFALLYALGDWVGLPSRYSGNPVPPLLAKGSAAVTPWLAPVHAAAISRGLAIACLAAALLVTAVCLRFVFHALHAEAVRAGEEAGVDQSLLRQLGFFRAFIFATCSLAMLWVPVLGGAIADRAWRYELLLHDIAALRDAPVVMQEAAAGMGSRMRLFAHSDGVLIRNANVRELIAISNGVTSFAVWSTQMYTNREDAQASWFLTPRYDVKINAALRHPEEFDPLALKQRMTRFLVARFGVEIHVNGKCQKPCGRWDTSEGVKLPAELSLRPDR